MLLILNDDEMKTYESLTNFGIANNIVLIHLVETEEVEVIGESELDEPEEEETEEGDNIEI